MSTSSRSWSVVWCARALSIVAVLAGAPRADAAETVEGPAPDQASSAADAVAALVAFLERADEPARGEGDSASRERGEERRAGPPGRRGGDRGHGRRGAPDSRAEAARGAAPAEAKRPERPPSPERPRADARPQAPRWPSPRRPFDDGPPPMARPEGRDHGAPQVRAFAFQAGPDGVAKQVAPGGPPAGGPRHREERRQITVHVDGGELRLDGIPGLGASGPITLNGMPGIVGPIRGEGMVFTLDGGPAEGDAHAHVRQLLDRILDKVNAIEARLGGPGAPPHPGQPPLHGGPQGPGPQPLGAQHLGPQQLGPGPQNPPPPPPPPPQQPAAGPQPHHVQPGPQGPFPHQGPAPGAMMHPDELNRRFEEHARDLHARLEEMARRFKEQAQAGGGEHVKQAHQKFAEMHEKVQRAFEDVRRRFAEQQERLERLEQEVRRMREELERRSHGGENPPRKPVSIEAEATL